VGSVSIESSSRQPALQSVRLPDAFIHAHPELGAEDIGE
jgi:hypothetical protein